MRGEIDRRLGEKYITWSLITLVLHSTFLGHQIKEDGSGGSHNTNWGKEINVCTVL
jgi:hypothetical protein